MRNKRVKHILRKLGLDKGLNEKLNIVKEAYKHRTADVPFEDAMELDDFLRLLEIAEYSYPIGMSSAIKYAFGLGYLAGLGELKEGYSPEEVGNLVDVWSGISEMLEHIDIEEMPRIYDYLKEMYFAE